MKAGFGLVEREVLPGVRMLAAAAVNALGDVRDPGTGKVIAGSRDPATGRPGLGLERLVEGTNRGAGFESTTLAAVCIGLALDRTRLHKVAQMAHDGLARAIEPVHTMYDGDAVFALATGTRITPSPEAEVSVVGALAARLVAEAIVAAVTRAKGLGGLPALADL
jgi:L-aminopeptidase/D-esterase-like protein